MTWDCSPNIVSTFETSNSNVFSNNILSMVIRRYFARSTQNNARRNTTESCKPEFFLVSRRALMPLLNYWQQPTKIWSSGCQNERRGATLFFISPIKVIQPRTKLWHQVDILRFKCRLDLKGLVSCMSLSPTDNVSDHYNDNQASQNSCDNDWD